MDCEFCLLGESVDLAECGETCICGGAELAAALEVVQAVFEGFEGFFHCVCLGGDGGLEEMGFESGTFGLSEGHLCFASPNTVRIPTDKRVLRGVIAFFQ